MKLSWSHAVLRVRDLDAMIAFYHDMLDFEVSDRGPLGPPGSPEIAFMTGRSSDHHQLGLVPLRGSEEATSLEHMAFRVESLADVREMHDRAKQDERAGDPGAITHGNAISVYFTDPERNTIEVFVDTPWHVKQPVIQGWDPTMTDEELLAHVESLYRDAPEFMPMEAYRAKRAKYFGET